MSKLEVSSYTPQVMTDTVYLHVQPRGWNGVIRSAVVTKMTKTLDAEVEPRTFIVKVEVVVPKRLFSEAVPTARIEIQPGDIVPVVTLLDAEADGEVGA